MQNFENQNPANTLWSKPYNLYSKIDTEPPRYLGFERWWGGHVNLNAAEIQFIVDELFIGNELAAGGIVTSNGTVIDLRSIRSPIVVFCSKGDNITPPQQALGWILDLYDSVEDIRSYGQTIVYTIHESIGHLGIFVSSGVARKEHDQFASNIDLIECLPPGLYEAVLEAKTEDTAHADLVSGDWVMRCEARTLGDIRALGGNDAADERRFATAARVSEINLALYRTFAQPLVRAMVGAPLAGFLRHLHPLRLQYEFLSDANPLMAPLATLAAQVRAQRKPVASDNPFVAAQGGASDQIVAALDAWRVCCETLAERMFLSIYGSPPLQAAVGIDATGTGSLRKAAKNPLHRELLKKRVAALEAAVPAGGSRAAVIRALLYAGMSRASIDERGFEALRLIRHAHTDLTPAEFKALVREQFNILLINQKAALAAIPGMLPSDDKKRRKAFELIEQVLDVRGEHSTEVRVRLAEVARLFGVEKGKTGGSSDVRHPKGGRRAPRRPTASRASHSPRR